MMLALVAVLLLLAGAAAEAQQLGAVEIVSQSGVEVVWEGISLGTTDAEGRLVIEQVPPGEYSLALRKRGLEGRTVALQVPGGEATRLRLLLQERAAAPPPSPPSPQREPPAAATDPAPPVEPAERAAPAEAGAESPRPPAQAGATGPVEPRTEPAPPVATPITSPAEMAAAAGGEPAAPAAESSGRGFLVPALAAIALLGVASWVLLPRRRGRLAAAGPPPEPDHHVVTFDEARTVSDGPEAPLLIEELRQRERDLVAPVGRPWQRRAARIIDVEVIEVPETEEEA